MVSRPGVVHLILPLSLSLSRQGVAKPHRLRSDCWEQIGNYLTGITNSVFLSFFALGVQIGGIFGRSWLSQAG